MKNQVLKVSLLCGIGGLLEFYDFILFIIFSDQISKHFFAAISSPIVKQFIVIAVFSIAYLIRPIGGILVGWLGDRKGRKTSFAMTILIMGSSVFLMGIMPDYSQIGVAAPLIFVTLRIIQGFALGGELPSAIVFVFESLEKKGLALGIMFGLVLSGFAFGEGMSIILRHFFDEYAWRAAFISGSLIGFMAYYIRSRLNETDLFQHLHHKEKFPPAVLFRDYLQNTIGATLCVTIVAFYGAIVSLYLPKYLTQHLYYDIKYVNVIMLYSAILSSSCVVFISWLSDFVNHRKFFKYLSCALIIIAYPTFYLINTDSTFGLILGVTLISIITALATGLFMKICCEAFPTNVRLTGVAVAYNFAFAILGGLAPITTEILIKLIGLSFGPSIIAMFCGLCGLCSIPLLAKKQFIN